MHPDFRAILTSNSIEYAGVHKPQDALLDRLVSLYMDFYSYETEVNIVLEHTAVSRENARKIVGVVRAMRDRLPEAQKPGHKGVYHDRERAEGSERASGNKARSDMHGRDGGQTCSSVELHEKQSMVKDILKEIA